MLRRVVRRGMARLAALPPPCGAQPGLASGRGTFTSRNKPHTLRFAFPVELR